jgi:hypothetical protein
LQVVTNQPADSIIVYATSAGSIAADGEGRNELFTSQLLKNLRTPGLEVTELFRLTGADVSRASGRKQISAIYNQFFGMAYLGEKPQAAVVTPLPVQPAAPKPETAPKPVPALPSTPKLPESRPGEPAPKEGSPAKFPATKSSYQNGDIGPAGGPVFFFNGKRMEAAPASVEFEENWYYAVKYCQSLKVQGISGWRLPTRDELNTMYTELKKKSLGGFSNGFYWSSEDDNLVVWGRWFGDGNQDFRGKEYGYSIRPVRAF